MTNSLSPAYAGEISVADAYAALQATERSALVDVRTEPEWLYVGTPDLSALEKKPLLLEWQTYPDMAVDPTFIERLDEALRRRGLDMDAPIYFLCRSGVRSRAAAIAATQAGWKRCYNVTEGFEGPRDASGHRGRDRGWKAAGLPWSQT